MKKKQKRKTPQSMWEYTVYNKWLNIVRSLSSLTYRFLELLMSTLIIWCERPRLIKSNLILNIKNRLGHGTFFIRSTIFIYSFVSFILEDISAFYLFDFCFHRSQNVQNQVDSSSMSRVPIDFNP